MLGQKKFQSSIIAGPENKKRVLTGDSSLDRELADIILRIKNAEILMNKSVFQIRAVNSAEIPARIGQ